MSKLDDTIRSIIREAGSLPAVPLDDDQPLYTVGLDSLDIATILVEIETQLGVRLAGEDLAVPASQLTPRYLMNQVTSYLMVDAK